LQDVIIFLGQRDMGQIMAGELLKQLNAPDTTQDALLEDSGWVRKREGWNREIRTPGRTWIASVSPMGRRWFALERKPGDGPSENGESTGPEQAKAAAERALIRCGAPISPDSGIA
jgi:hypothetical protein